MLYKQGDVLFFNRLSSVMIAYSQGIAKAQCQFSSDDSPYRFILLNNVLRLILRASAVSVRLVMLYAYLMHALHLRAVELIHVTVYIM